MFQRIIFCSCTGTNKAVGFTHLHHRRLDNTCLVPIMAEVKTQRRYLFHISHHYDRCWLTSTWRRGIFDHNWFNVNLPIPGLTVQYRDKVDYADFDILINSCTAHLGSWQGHVKSSVLLWSHMPRRYIVRSHHQPHWCLKWWREYCISPTSLMFFHHHSINISMA